MRSRHQPIQNIFIRFTAPRWPRRFGGELFGHEKGSYRSDRPSADALNRQGTIFLDEIGEIDCRQVKLLRVLQERPSSG